MFKLPNVWGTLCIKEMYCEGHNSRRKKNVLYYFSRAGLGWGKTLFFEDSQSVAHLLKMGVKKEEIQMEQ